MFTPLLEMIGIYKSFHDHYVLKNVDFDLKMSEIHALLGENGAGKSTLMKILGGVYTKDRGTIRIAGQDVEIDSPRTASQLGIAMIHQELNLVPNLTVMENIFLGQEMSRGKWMKKSVMKEEAEWVLRNLGVDIDPTYKVEDLSLGQQQIVEIAKALTKRARMIILDEPTAALTNQEIDSLFDVLTKLKKKLVSMIYITHRLEEIFRICDRVTVLRDGAYINTKKTSHTNMDEVIYMMVGREIKNWYPERQSVFGRERFRVEGLTGREKVKDVSFSIRSGEILGITGLMGSGRSEVADMIFGIKSPLQGRMYLDEKYVEVQTPADAIELGIGYVTEDRKNRDLVLNQSIESNLVLSHLSKLASWLWIHKKRSNRVSELLMDHLKIRPFNKDLEIESLSGGNQQKVVLGKWLATKPKLLILDEPTRGVDVGARVEIYKLINDLTNEGISVLLISSDLPEVIKLSDRVMVMREGRIAGELSREQATQETVMKIASGGGLSVEISYSKQC